MARGKQGAPTEGSTGLPAAEAADIARLVEELDAMLSRLRLGAIREQLDGLLDEAARRQLNLREALAWLCAAEVASKEQRWRWAEKLLAATRCSSPPRWNCWGRW